MLRKKNTNENKIDDSKDYSYYEKRYGRGKTMNVPMTFEILKYSMIALVAIIILLLGAVVYCASAGIENNVLYDLLKVFCNIFGGAIMALVGFFIGRKVD